jgi:hypothetical protein
LLTECGDEFRNSSTEILSVDSGALKSDRQTSHLHDGIAEMQVTKKQNLGASQK